jgi:hypothetical protein
MSNRAITVLAVGLSTTYLVLVVAFVGFRLASGMTAVPHGFGPLLLGLNAGVPVACVALATFLRLRRDRNDQLRG